MRAPLLGLTKDDSRLGASKFEGKAVPPELQGTDKKDE